MHVVDIADLNASFAINQEIRVEKLGSPEGMKENERSRSRLE